MAKRNGNGKFTDFKSYFTGMFFEVLGTCLLLVFLYLVHLAVRSFRW